MNKQRKFTRGDVRESDGSIFQGYRVRDGRVCEDWASPAAVARANAKRTERSHSLRRPADWKCTLKSGDPMPDAPEYAHMRANTKVFWNYNRNGRLGGSVYEIWVTPERLQELRDIQCGKLRPNTFRARDRKPNRTTNHMLEQFRIEHAQLVTNQQLLRDAKTLVANAMRNGLISKR